MQSIHDQRRWTEGSTSQCGHSVTNCPNASDLMHDLYQHCQQTWVPNPSLPTYWPTDGSSTSYVSLKVSTKQLCKSKLCKSILTHMGPKTFFLFKNVLNWCKYRAKVPYVPFTNHSKLLLEYICLACKYEVFEKKRFFVSLCAMLSWVKLDRKKPFQWSFPFPVARAKQFPAAMSGTYVRSSMSCYLFL